MVYFFTHEICLHIHCLTLQTVGAGFGGEGSEVVAVLEGERANLVCGTDLTGNPIPNVTWTNNNDKSDSLVCNFNGNLCSQSKSTNTSQCLCTAMVCNQLDHNAIFGLLQCAGVRGRQDLSEQW